MGTSPSQISGLSACPFSCARQRNPYTFGARRGQHCCSSRALNSQHYDETEEVSLLVLSQFDALG